MMDPSPQCYIPNFVEIGPLVPEKKVFEGFFTIMLINFLFHVPKKLTYSPRCYMPSFVEIGPPVPEKKIFEWFLLAGILVM